MHRSSTTMAAASLALFGLLAAGHVGASADGVQGHGRERPRALVAQHAAPAPIVVYVDDFVVDEKLKQDGGGLASAFCSDLSKDKGLDVVCANDIQSLMGFEAMRGIAGAVTAGGAPAIKKRLSQVDVVVTGEVRQGKHGLISIISVHDRDRTAGDEIVTPAGLRGRVHVKGISNGVSGLTGRFPEFAKRAAAIVRQGPSGRSQHDVLPDAKVVDDPNAKARVIDEKATVAE